MGSLLSCLLMQMFNIYSVIQKCTMPPELIIKSDRPINVYKVIRQISGIMSKNTLNIGGPIQSALFDRPGVAGAVLQTVLSLIN